MESIQNTDLLSVGIATAAIGILGFVVFFNNRRSITAWTFLLFAVATIFYSVFNYLASLPIGSPNAILWLLRITIFFVVWHAFGIFQLFYVFPFQSYHFSRLYKFALIPLVSITALSTLTPYVFSEIAEFSTDGRVTRVTNGPGIVLFGLTVVGLIASGVFILLRKTKKAQGVERAQLFYILAGSLITFPLYITFNFVLPTVFGNARFVPLAAVFSFPLFSLTAYAIFKHHLLNVKIIATEILVFLLVVSTFFEVILARTFVEILLRGGIFVLLMIFSISLIRGVRKEVEQREQLEILTAELARANAELKKLDQLKSEFISIASHQLRTPLTVIKGYVSMVLDGTFGKVSVEVVGALLKVLTVAEQLVKLVGDMLNLSRIESGRIKYDFVENDLVKVIKEVKDELLPKAYEKGLEVKFENKFQDSIILTFDRDKVREIVINLIDNAIKYSKEGLVIVKIEAVEPAVVFSVRDQGLGFNQEGQARLFKKFERTEESKKVDPSGMGLGLYFVKRVAVDHGGRVWAESEGVGKGSTFFVELPSNKKIKIQRSKFKMKPLI